MRNSPWAMLITPICPKVRVRPRAARKRIAPVAVPVRKGVVSTSIATLSGVGRGCHAVRRGTPGVLRVRARRHSRSEEHTSELQSLMRLSYDVFCLQKKNIDIELT